MPQAQVPLLYNGQRISGSYDGVKFTGHIYELHKGISSLVLDRPIYVRGSWHHDRFSMGIDIATGKTNCDDHFHDRTDHVKPIPDVPGSEYTLYPVSDFVMDHLKKEHRVESLHDYTASIERRLTTYRTVRRAVTCEYGHKHMVDQREPIKPVLNTLQINLSYFWLCLAQFARYTEDIEYQKRQQAWSQLSTRLSLGGGAFMSASDYTGLCPESVKAIKQALHDTYESICDDAVIAIFGTTGPYLNRYLGYEQRVSRSNRRAHIEKKLNGKITPDGLALNTESSSSPQEN